MTELINYSEFATLARCETQWGYAYLLNQEEPGEKAGMHRGTLLHVGADRWLRGLGATLPEEWTDDINTGGKPGVERTLRLDSFDPLLVEQARWLLSRYEAHYGSVPPANWEIVSSEEWLTCEVTAPGGTFRIVGRTDGLIRVFPNKAKRGKGKLWLREVKSAANIKQRLLTVDVEPQPTIYYALVEANYGERPQGILFDGINTYQWKPERPTQSALIEEASKTALFLHEYPTGKLQREWAKAQVEQHPGVERPAADSFQRAWPDRTPEQIDIGMQYLRSAIEHREQLRHGGLDVTLPNVGQSCNSCGFKPRCWARLLGEDEDIEVEYDDDEAEPV
jgi:PD-(D/E)XK nuclease superfamily